MNPFGLKFLLLLMLALPGARPDGSAPAPAPAAQNGGSVADVCGIDNTTFRAGEQIVYKLYYNWNFVWLPAGEVTFNVHDLENQYRITVRGRTYPSYEWFYKVTDNYTSYLDKETLLPQIHIKDIQEGGYQRYDRTTFYQDEQRIVSHRGKTRQDTKPKYMDVDPCMHDLISIIYFARNLDYASLQPKQEIPIKILMDQEMHPLKIRYLGPEPDVKVKGSGRFNTLRFSPQLITGELFKEGDEMKIYVSNDRNKIPVMIESPVTVGSVKAVLKSYKGLRYPMEAKVGEE
ncbi:hypothetical protein GGR26_003565 [Lewinella marina]|uniref:DUF3108 domain-containing protein n=1 Tax=Neolewinella marina TaxID=438751 RepID=A0A2G0CB83_9BACT|nr:DUF3108 domain-containing protein [Neolewinella marina]NJB87779.1 hypothetical protein [Neolewinella marina]PHK97249.1 hypothetical protein CGL56_16860 [Neolewinella marina]